MIPLDTPTEGPPAVPLPRVAGFIRQVTHDVRNGLNSMDLQAAYLAELITDEEAAEELRRLRGLIQSTARQLQAVSGNFWTGTPSLVTYSARILIEDLQDRLARTFPEKAGQVQWTLDLAEESVTIDIEMLFSAYTRLFDNAFQFAEPDAKIAAHAFAEDGQFVLELREPRASVQSDPATWGLEPFISTRRGAYGLGLFRARAFLAVQGGELRIIHDSGRALLITRVSLPLAPPE